MPLEFVFVRGADAIADDPILRSNEAGEGQLHSMHEYVVPGLAKLVGEKPLEGRWKDRAAASGNTYYAAYLHEGGEVKSIVSGVITKTNLMRVINTATLPDLRGRGYLLATLSHLVMSHSEGVRAIDATLTSGLKAAEIPGVGLDEVKAILAAANEIVATPAAESLTARQRMMAALEIADNTEGKRVYAALNEGDFWGKSNFAIMEKLFGKFSQTGRLRFEVGNDTHNINFAPEFGLTKELSDFCAVVLDGFHGHSGGVAEASAARLDGGARGVALGAD